MLRHKDRPPPSPSYMSEDQMASYLKDLRANKPRPVGSRPPPPSKFGSLRRTETERAEGSNGHVGELRQDGARPGFAQSNSMPIMPPQGMTRERPKSNLGMDNVFAGRPLARAPSPAISDNKGLEPEQPTSRRPNSAVYLEQGSRWMEKQEARSLRMALEDMDMAKEQKIHDDAQDEAAELVWKHKNPEAASAKADAPFENPDVKRDYRSHLNRGSYARTHSQEGVPQVDSRNSFSSKGSQRASIDRSAMSSLGSGESAAKASSPTESISPQKSRTPSGKNYGELAAAVKSDIDNARRRTSSGSRRILSGEKKKFMHPDDRIYEDPQEEATPPKKQPPPQPIPDLRPSPSPVQPAHMRKNPFARVRAQQEKFERTHSAPQLHQPVPRLDRVEIQKNPPTQSRNPWYVSNEPIPPTPPRSESMPADEVSPKGTPTREGREIRSDDIRSATSKQRKDRSPNLPQPTMVSGKPGRPIVSFDAQKPKEIVMEEVKAPAGPSASSLGSPSKPSRPSDSPRPSPFLRNTIPRFEPPKINLNGAPNPPMPTINLPDEPAAPRSSTPTNYFPPETSGPRPPIPILNLPDDDESHLPKVVLPEEPDFADISSGPPTPAFVVTPPTISVNGPGFSTRPDLHHSATTSSTVPHARPTPPLQVQSRPASRTGTHHSQFHQSQQPHHPAYQPHQQHQHQPHRPLPTPTQSSSLNHARTAPLPARHTKSTPHYTPSHTPSLKQSTALCAACALPITGRVLSASGSRFHPHCFTCSACSTNLELVAFYPEPESAKSERLHQSEGAGHSGDVSPLFYCHLDYHELFSPRCKTCTTPIESEIILACGAAYHSGHFFCAQCGDPFDKSTPFVEKEGYAWCVGCHTNRYSAKCKGCRKPVTETVVKALGAEWHETCFVCVECGGEFEDGRYFLRGDEGMPVCVGCEERRLKA